MPSIKRRRREDRGAEGAEGGGVLGEGVSSSPADYCLSCVFFFCSISNITHKPLHLPRQYLAGTCLLTTARTLLISEVIGQRSRSRGLFTVLLCA